KAAGRRLYRGQKRFTRSVEDSEARKLVFQKTKNLPRFLSFRASRETLLASIAGGSVGGVFGGGAACCGGSVAASGEEGVGVRYLDDRGESRGMVGRPLVEGLGDAVADEVAEVAGPVGCFGALVVEPAAHVGAVHLRLELRPQRGLVRQPEGED